MLDQIFNFSTSTVSAAAVSFNFGTILFNILLAFALLLIVVLVYKKTHKGFSYSQSFILALILIGVLICVVMMVIGNSLARAFGAIGAFSLIRFRTAVKDSKDTAFVFFAVIVGMAVGTGNYLIALVAVTVISLIIVVLARINFGSIRKYDYILSFSIDTVKTSTEQTKPIFDKYLKVGTLLNVSARERGEVLEMTFNVKFFNEDEKDKFISELGTIEGIGGINLITSKNDIEY